MNTKDINLHKIIAAIVIGLVLAFMIGIVASGRQNKSEGENSGETDETISNGDESNGDTDSDDGTADNIIDSNTNSGDSSGDKTTESTAPEYTNYLTGLECEAEYVKTIPFVFLTDPDAPLYGISYSDITIEIPIENGNTRLMIYNKDITDLGKIGSITYTRDYITQLTKFFGGIMVAYGEDDIISYTSIASTVQIDLSSNRDYIYKENGKNNYTDSQSLLELIAREGIDTESYKTQPIPYEFCGFDELISGKNPSNVVKIPYAQGQETVLKYDDAMKKYVFSKGGRNKVDMLTGENASYTNVFILFSDSVTYEMSSGVESVIETATEGTGYYATFGSLIEIRWNVDDNNQLIFEDLNGEKLTVNRGNSYIGYYKSSDKSSVVFE